MSSTENPDPERDERIDFAWRATSRDEPPAALDELIRAAARREVGAGPLRSRRPAWLRVLPSLAAAAAVAVVAVGIVQLAPPEQVTPMPTTAARGDASDTTSATSPAAAKPIASGESQAKEERSSSDQRRPENPLAKAAPQLDSLVESQQPRSTNATPLVPAPSASTPPTMPPATPPASASATRHTASASDAASASPAPSAVPAPSSQALPQARHGDPFPGANQGTGPAPAAKISSSASERDEPSQAAGGLSKDLSPSPQPPTRHDASGQLTSHNEPGARAERAKTAGATAAAQSDALAGETPARTIDDWVRRLRRLKEQGATEELLKELAAFRVIYGAGANALLPADLRDIKP